MSLASVLAAGAGRQFDVTALRGARATGEVLLDQSLLDAQSAGSLCTGIAKLAQWFAVELLTPAGSMPYDPARGTGLIPALVQGRLRTETDLFIAFGFAVGTITATARRIELGTEPPDERFEGAVLDSVEIAPDLVRLRVVLTSLAGTSRPILLPVSTVG